MAVRKQVLEILRVWSEKKPIKGEEREFVTAECIVHTDGEGVNVGRWSVPKEQRAAIKPGRYVADLELAVNFDGKIEGRIVGVQPVVVAAPKAA